VTVAVNERGRNVVNRESRDVKISNDVQGCIYDVGRN